MKTFLAVVVCLVSVAADKPQEKPADKPAEKKDKPPEKKPPEKPVKPMTFPAVRSAIAKADSLVYRAYRTGNDVQKEKAKEQSKTMLDDLTGKKVEGNAVVVSVQRDKEKKDVLGISLRQEGGGLSIFCYSPANPFIESLVRGQTVKVAGVIESLTRQVGDGLILKDATVSKPPPKMRIR